jgi:hypothetical protein
VTDVPSGPSLDSTSPPLRETTRVDVIFVFIHMGFDVKKMLIIFKYKYHLHYVINSTEFYFVNTREFLKIFNIFYNFSNMINTCIMMIIMIRAIIDTYLDILII